MMNVTSTKDFFTLIVCLIVCCFCLVSSGLNNLYSPYHQGQSGGLARDGFDMIREQFHSPPNEYRLIQYTHTLNPEEVRDFSDYGAGGVMAFLDRYLYHPEHKDRAQIRKRLQYAIDNGLHVWLADDFGYPSGMAGGQVVEENPDFEVRGMFHMAKQGQGRGTVSVAIPDDAERFVAAVIYPLKDGSPDLSRGRVVPVTNEQQISTTGLRGEWQLSVFAQQVRDHDAQAQSTMAQFEHSGRYPDLMNPDAINRFLELMHAELAKEAGDLFTNVMGFYTNEPNLMQLPWDWRNQETRKYAFLAFNEELPRQFKQMHGYDLMPHLAALYEGESDEARRIRLHYQQTVAEMLTESFARQIRRWCEARDVYSSGHFLLNEYLSMHVAGYGDLMKFASEFHLPALDIGIPNPDRMDGFPYQQAKFFSSIASWKERDEVICLPDPIIAGGGLKRLSPAIPLVKNTANMAFLKGANYFTSYLYIHPTSGEREATGYTPEEYIGLNEYIGRISLLLRKAKIETNVGLYYPIAMFQADYKPSINLWHVAIRTYQDRQLAWEQTEHALLDNGIDYLIIHPEGLKEATVSNNGLLTIGSGSFHYLVMPQVEILSVAEMKKIKEFEAAGGIVYWIDNLPEMGVYQHEDKAVIKGVRGYEVTEASDLPGKIERPFSNEFYLDIDHGNQNVAIARFRKESNCLYYLVNRGENPVTIDIKADHIGMVELFNPKTGEISRLNQSDEIEIDGFNSVILVHPKPL